MIEDTTGNFLCKFKCPISVKEYSTASDGWQTIKYHMVLIKNMSTKCVAIATHFVSRPCQMIFLNNLLDLPLPSDKAQLLSVSVLYAAKWLSAILSIGLGLHMDSDEFQTAVKWWLGMETSCGSTCSLCPNSGLDPLGHSCCYMQMWR